MQNWKEDEVNWKKCRDVVYKKSCIFRVCNSLNKTNTKPYVFLCNVVRGQKAMSPKIHEKETYKQVIFIIHSNIALSLT